MEAANNAKHVVSISLGSSKRDAGAILELGGRKISIERRGTDGDFDRARQLLEQWDGKADAIGLGGTELNVYFGFFHVCSVSSLRYHCLQLLIRKKRRRYIDISF